jgi:hypothetical protein
MSSRFAAWKNGEYASLLSSVSPVTYSDSRDPLSVAKSLAAAGEYGKAVAALAPSPRIETDNKSTEVLQSKHPKGPPVATQTVPPKPLVISEDVIKKMIHTFPSGSSPGPMGLRGEHLRASIKPHLQVNLLETLAKFVNVLIAGEINPVLAPFLAGASLSALEKKDGGIRPLACGNLLRRLASKCICCVTKDRFREHLSPHQVGVAVPGGAEIIIHEAREIYKRFDEDETYSKFGYLKVDFRNAFNEVSRQAIYDELVIHFPEIVPYFSWCYANPSILFFGDFKVSSESGVQQGDPLGPFFFSLALRKLILSIQEVHPALMLNRWYLDDGNIAAKFSKLSKILNHIDKFGPPLGFHLNRSKCQVYGFRSSPPPLLFPKVELGLSDFDTLGAPIGSSNHCLTFVCSKLQKVYEIFKSLVKLNDSQIAFTLLRNCCSFGKIVYFLRTIPPNLIEPACIEFDKQVLLCLEDILSCSLDKPGLSQARLPTSKGGIGLRSAFQHATACYIASASSAKKASPLAISIVDSVYEAYNLLVQEPISPVNEPRSQKILSKKIDSLNLTSLLTSASESSKARLRSILGPHATAWLNVIPSSNLGLKFNNSQYQTTMKLFLGLPVYPKDSKCCCQAPLDKLGAHSLVCKKKGDIIVRHNAVRDVIHDFAKDAGLSVEKEKAGLLGDYGDKRRPADVLIYNFSQNSDYCLDMAVTSPLQAKYVSDAAKTDAHAASHYYQFKISKYAREVEAANMTFKPIVFESYGRIAPESIETLVRIASIRADRYSSPRSESIHQFFQKISVALQIRNANMVLKRDSILG